MSKISFQCNHKVIINMNKNNLTKEIYPYLNGRLNNSDSDIMFKNFISLDIDKLLESLKKIKKILKEVKEDVQLFVFRKKEVVIVDGNVEHREVSYFRLIILQDLIYSYEDYNYKILFNTTHFMDLLYYKINRFNQIVCLSEKKDIDIKDYDILLPPGVGGYFIHETVGHLLEVDNLSIYNLKDKIKCDFLSVTDEIKGYENFVGLSKYDDENFEMNRVELIKNGKIINLMSTENGFARTESIVKNIIPRMRVTYVENCDLFKFNCYERYLDYLKVDQIFGGGVDFRTGIYQLLIRGIIYKDGKPIYRVENLIFSGESQESLERILFIGKDLKIFHAYCLKNDQMIDVCVGSPTIYLKKG